MSTMRIAHFSDLHLLSLAGARILDYANKRWIGRLNLLTSRSRHYHSHIFAAMVEDVNACSVDHVVCTGDLTNLALEQEFRFALEFFQRLDLEPSEITVIPGNHDSYVAEGLDHFRAFFGPYHQSDAEWQSDAQWPVVRVRGRVAFIALSTSRPSPWFTAYGRIGADQLERLAAILADPRLADKLRLVALHHPPNGRAARNRIRGLKDHARLQDVIAKHGAELLLHGHEHRDMRTSMAGPDGRSVDVLGIQSGTYLANQPHRTARYRILEIESESPRSSDGAHGDAQAESDARPRVRSHHLRLWDAASSTFIDDPDDAGDGEEAVANGAAVA